MIVVELKSGRFAIATIQLFFIPDETNICGHDFQHKAYNYSTLQFLFLYDSCEFVLSLVLLLSSQRHMEKKLLSRLVRGIPSFEKGQN